jgi:hypothetical protein
VRPGPGGGVFVGERSALAGMLRDVRGLEPDVVQVGRVLAALALLIVADAIAALDDAGRRRLEQALAALDAARDGALGDFVEAGLEVFDDDRVAAADRGADGHGRRAAAHAARRPGSGHQPDRRGPRELVDRHAAAVARLVHAILARDREAALRAGLDPELMVIFAAAPTPS